MKSIGIDLHKRIIVACVMNDKREIVSEKKFRNDQREEMKSYFKSFQPFQAAFEATAAYDWFYELLTPLAKRVAIAHPKRLRIIAESKKKSDKVDAQVLAQFLALDILPESHCPSPFMKGYRELVRFRCQMQSRITSIKNRIRNILSRSNQDRKDLFSREGRAWLTHVKLKETARFQIDRLLEELALFETHKKETEEKIRAYTKKAPARVTEALALVRTIPGVGEITADVVVSELGDVNRFPSQKDVCSYAGLAPGRRQTAEREINLPITKEGSRLLRWILVEAAWNAVRYSQKWERMYTTLCERTRNPNKAIVAVARKLLCVIYALLRDGRPYCATV